MSTPTTFDADRPSGGSWHALPRTMTARLNATTPAVLDVQLRSGVAGLRGLGRAGLGPVALGRSWADAGLWSRHASAKAVIKGAAGSPQRIADAILHASGPIVPYPGEERTIDAILAAATMTPRVVAPFPAAPTRLLRQKSHLAELARDAGIAVPWTQAVATAAELRGARLRFPCVIKSDDPVGSLSATHIVTSREELEAHLDRLPADEPVVVQERLGGPLVCLAMVIDRAGAVVSRFQHVAESTWPAAAGPTARAVSVAPDAKLVARAARLLRAVGYWGLVQLDFLPGRHGLALVDANPRYYPALALATACGVNLPAAWHKVVVGAPTPVPGDYRVGANYRWLEADVVAALRGRPSRLLRRAGGPTTGAMWHAEDPAPAALLAAVAVASRTTTRMRSAIMPGRRGSS